VFKTLRGTLAIWIGLISYFCCLSCHVYSLIITLETSVADPSVHSSDRRKMFVCEEESRSSLWLYLWSEILKKNYDEQFIFTNQIKLNVLLNAGRWEFESYTERKQTRLFSSFSFSTSYFFFQYKSSITFLCYCLVECHKNQHQSEILSPETNSTCVEGQCIMVLSQLKLPKLCFKLVPFSRPAEVECTCEQCNAWYTIDIKAM